MSSYVPVNWVDGSTPVNAANLNKMEDRIELLDALKVPSPSGQDGKWLTVAGGAMLWAAAPAGGGGGGLDWEGVWAAPTAYVKGDVVTYGGVTYGAVNDSTGQTPPAASTFLPAVPVPLVTALPSTPFDGQEVIFTDSLTAPTYTWRLRYVAAKTTNKWVFIGGSPVAAEVTTGEQCTIAAYGNLATVGPTLVVPLAGEYLVTVQYRLSAADATAGVIYMSYDIGATGANDTDATIVAKDNTVNALYSSNREARKTFAVATTLVAKYKRSAGSPSLANRGIKLLPVAVGG